MKIRLLDYRGFVCVLMVLANPLSAYDLIDRVNLMEDRASTHQTIAPYGRDFLFDLSTGITGDVMDLIDVASDISKLNTSDMDAAIAQATTMISPYYDKEQTLRMKLDLGVPLFSFDAYHFHFSPNIRFGASFTGVFHPYESSLSFTKVISNLTQVPSEIREKLTDPSCIATLNGLPEGSNILVDAVPACLSAEEAEVIKQAYGISSFPLYKDFLSTEVEMPAFDLFAMMNVYTKFLVDYESEDKHWFGFFSMGAKGRVDVLKALDVSMLMAGAASDALDVRDNKKIYLTADYQLGYKKDHMTLSASLEDIPITTVQSTTDAELNNTLSMLIRLQATAQYQLGSLLKVLTYAGTHSRKGYGLLDAYYAGADWGLHVWKDRFGITLKTMIDKEHATLGLRSKLWLMHLDLGAKLPVTSDVDGAKVSSVYMANLRFFF